MSAYIKDLFREIKHTLGRFFSLLIITALGAASVVGIQASSIDMRNIADKTYKEHGLYDLQIKSTVGFDEDDAAALSGTAGVSAVMLTTIYDAFVDIGGENRAARTYALPGEINTIDLLDGRFPVNAGECAVERRLLREGGVRVGDTIRLLLDDMDDYFDVFAGDTYTIVGVISSPLYISHERGNTSIGDGSLRYYLYLHPDAYTLDVYTDAYLRMDGSREMDNLTDGYYAAADRWKRQAEQTGKTRAQIKKDELADAQREIDDVQAQIDEARSQLEETLAGLAMMGPQGVSEELDAYYEQAAAALHEIDDKQTELEEAQEKLDGAPTPEWFAFTRKDGLSFDSYYNDTLRLEKISYVFPLVFFLVAVMVSLTSMSRMVEEHRTQIGVYKALGYRPAAIMMKYLIYAFGASFFGAAAGAVAGSRVFPAIISDAYGHMYDMPPVETPIPLLIAVLAVLSAVLSVLLVTLGSCISSLIGTPAQLMRPKPPVAGKRVWMERIPLLWKRLNFFGKVAGRNIFRYKKRFIMTLAGVAGCSALLLMGFGLRDSIGGVADIQFGRIVEYGARAYLKDIDTARQRAELDAGLPDAHLYIREEAVTGHGPGGGLPAAIVIPESPEALEAYFNLYDPVTDEPVPMGPDSVLLTEKLARVMGVSAGGSFSMTYSDGRTFTAVATGIVDNYILHYIYMSPGVYAELFGAEPHPNSVLLLGAEFPAPLLKNENVRAVIYSTDLLSQLSDATDAMGVVTIVLIVLACALAFVVLFNLTNINISERLRELATIKVLGFYSGELAMYIYRENGVVTLMGILLGLLCGVFLHGFILATAELDILKFPQVIKPQSFLYSVALSVAFAVFVNLVMNTKLARIDMVESLKNVE